jgi:hypothetical protein
MSAHTTPRQQQHTTHSHSGRFTSACHCRRRLLRSEEERRRHRRRRHMRRHCHRQQRQHALTVAAAAPAAVVAGAVVAAGGVCNRSSSTSATPHRPHMRGSDERTAAPTARPRHSSTRAIQRTSAHTSDTTHTTQPHSAHRTLTGSGSGSDAAAGVCITKHDTPSDSHHS